jgi:hypothetical protein
MSDFLINIRFGMIHFQLSKDFKYCAFSKNYYHCGYPFGFFKVYDFFWYHN